MPTFNPDIQTATNGGASTSVTISMPAGAEGDQLIGFMATLINTQIENAGGFDILEAAQYGFADLSWIYAFSRKRQASEPASVTWTVGAATRLSASLGSFPPGEYDSYSSDVNNFGASIIPWPDPDSDAIPDPITVLGGVVALGFSTLGETPNPTITPGAGVGSDYASVTTGMSGTLWLVAGWHSVPVNDQVWYGWNSSAGQRLAAMVYRIADNRGWDLNWM